MYGEGLVCCDALVDFLRALGLLFLILRLLLLYILVL
jgi:hypothetical protein